MLEVNSCKGATFASNMHACYSIGTIYLLHIESSYRRYVASYLFTHSCSVVDLYFSAMEVSECCAICTHPVDSSVSTLGEKGSSLAINQASKLRKDSIHTVPGENVYQLPP